MTIFEKINGKKIDFQYDSGAHYQMTYLSDNELRWDALGQLSEGEAPTGTEPYWSEMITEDIYFINWIEADGMTASQVIDFSSHNVRAFLTWEDKEARGGREQVLLKGSFSIVD